MNKLSLMVVSILALLIACCNNITSNILNNNVAVVWTSYDEFDLNARDMLKLPHLKLSSSEKKAVARSIELISQMTEEEMMVSPPASIISDIMEQETGDFRFICQDEIVLSVSELPPYFHVLLSMNRTEEWNSIVSQISATMEKAKRMRNCKSLP